MTTTTKIQAQKISTSVKLFVALVLMVVSSTGAFAQNTTAVVSATTSTEVSVSKDATVVISTENTVASASMDFAVWFVGAKNNTNNTSATYSKKALINSGVRTNSVLIRSILKKVSGQGNSIA